jgi:hypothetical protein
MKESSQSYKNRDENSNNSEKSKDSMRKIAKWRNKSKEDSRKMSKEITGTENNRHNLCTSTNKSSKTSKRLKK